MFDQQAMRQRILGVANMIVPLEGGPVPVKDVRIVAAPAFFDHTYGTTILENDGSVVLRISAKRSVSDVADTVLHELAHVLLGVEHIDNPDHGVQFQKTYETLRGKYFDVVMEELTRD